MNRKYIKETRVNGEVQKELSRIIREEIKDPRIPAMTSVTDVEVTGDLKYAKIYISVLAGSEEKAACMKGLKSATPFIRTKLAKTINLRNTPELTFVLDESIEYGVEMSKKIAALGINKDDNDDAETDDDEE
ncbi:MAG: 30S ribosome-binding factor RbfA [Lachnospiraceae bacterium]|nr:30S ribosome-binding factor RbfA [Lachnospiraceae bacterium]